MAVVGYTNIKLGLIRDKFKTELAKVEGDLAKFKQVNADLTNQFRAGDRINREYSKGIGRLNRDMRNLGRTLAFAVTLPLAVLGATAAKNYAALERLEIGIGAVEGSAVQTELALRGMLSAAKLPGLGIKEANQFYLALRNVRFTAEQAERTVKSLGNSVALGGGGREQLGSLALQIPQLLAKGKVTQEDIKPIINASPVLSNIIQELYGTLDTTDIQAKLKEAGKSSRDFVAELVQAAEKLPQVESGWANALENLTDSTFVFTAELGRAAVDGFDLTSKLDGLVSGLDAASMALKGADPAVKAFVTGMLGITATVPLVILGIGSITTVLGTPWKAGLAAATRLWVGFTAALTSSVGAPIAIAVAIAALVAGLHSYNKATSEAVDFTDDVNKITKDATAAVSGQVTKLNQLVKVAGNVAVSDKERASAAKQVAEILGKTTKEINKETIANGQATKSIAGYIEMLKLKAKAQATYQLLQAKQSELDLANVKGAEEYVDFVDIMVAKLSNLNFGNTLSIGALLDAVGRGGEKKAAVINKLTKEIEYFRASLEKMVEDGSVTLDDVLSFGDLTATGSGLGEINKELEKLIEKRDKLKGATVGETEKLKAENDPDKFNSLRRLAFLEYDAAVESKKAEYEEVKKPLDEEYFAWYKARKEAFYQEMARIDKDYFLELTESLDKIERVTDYKVQSGYAKSLEKRLKNGLPKPKGVPFNDFTLPYEGMSKASQELKDLGEDLQTSFSNVAADVSVGLGNIVGEMISGAASIQDAGDVLLGSLADVLSQVSGILLKRGVLNLLSGNPFGVAMVTGGLFGSLFGGVLGGHMKQRQEVRVSQSTRLRGSDIYGSGKGHMRSVGY